MRVSDIIKNDFAALRGLSTATIYRHSKKLLLLGAEVRDGRLKNRKSGRKAKLSPQDIRSLKRGITVMREQHGTFSSKQLQEHCGLGHVSNSTVRRAIKRMGYKYLCSRKKGLMSVADMRQRVSFARKVQKRFGKLKDHQLQLWKDGINVYVDAVGFQYKVSNILDIC